MEPNKITLRYINEVYLQVECEDSIAMELRDEFSFKAPNAQWHPLVKLKKWDGIIRLLDNRTRTIYSGLRSKIKRFADTKGYEFSEESPFASDPFSVAEAQDFIKKLAPTMEPRDYQLLSFIKAIRDRRRLFLAPVNAGKSFIIFLIVQYLQKKTLIVVPTTGLILQMTQDFMEYDSKKDIDLDIHHIYEGKSHNTNKRITISTWQSIYKKPKAWFDQFECIIGDEAHKFKADSLVNIMKKADFCRYKIGTTGTLDGVEVNELVLEGVFGKLDKVTTNEELIKRKVSADIFIKCITLLYPDEIKEQLFDDRSYHKEFNYLITLPERNNFIANLAHSLDGNKLILFRYKEQGELLLDLITKKNKKGCKIYYIDGEVDIHYRNDIRKEIEEQDDAIIIASLGTFAEGVNIKRLNNVIFASPTKSKVKVLQSIGRGLRRSEIKTNVTLFDISDDLSLGNYLNVTARHFIHRVKMYRDEKFPYKQYKVRIKT